MSHPVPNVNPENVLPDDVINTQENVDLIIKNIKEHEDVTPEQTN